MTSGLQETLPLKKVKFLAALLLASTIAISIAYVYFTESIFTDLPSVLPHSLRIVKYKSPVNSSNGLVRASIKYVWPRKVGEDKDRIVSQINFMDKYARRHRQRSMKYILRVGDFNFYDFVEGQQRFIDDKCPINECSLTLNKSKAATVDALLITEYYKRQYVPKPPHQVWIAQHWESAKHDRINTRIASDLINWTVSYRRDSTIAISYGKYVPDTSFNETGYVDYSFGKTKQVSVLLLDCITSVLVVSM
jgi:Fucosyltransferase, N-terminal